ncbi:MAG: HYR domain-containing protein [Saprospiraceae bacterium]|nr:HYR domain-containing protein [Saprospiraceae bacterium]
MTISNDPAVCGAIHNYQTPIFVDNCDGLQNRTLTEGLASGSLFPVGTTTVTWQYTDVAGNGPTSCTFTVLVQDDENPMIFCEEVVATNQFTFETPMDIRPNDVTQAIIQVAPSMTITDFNILTLAGTQPDMGDLTVTLTSPAGTTVTFFDGLCSGTADFDMALDDAATAIVTTAACGPLGG